MTESICCFYGCIPKSKNKHHRPIQFWHIAIQYWELLLAHSVRKKIIPLFPVKKPPLPFLPSPVLKKSIPLHCTTSFFFWQLTLAEFCNTRGVSHLNPTSSHGSYSQKIQSDLSENSEFGNTIKWRYWYWRVLW